MVCLRNYNIHIYCEIFKLLQTDLSMKIVPILITKAFQINSSTLSQSTIFLQNVLRNKPFKKYVTYTLDGLSQCLLSTL